MQDVNNLVTLHPSQSGTAGRPAGDTGPLLRSTVVLLNTAWENYVERVAVEGLEFLLAKIGNDHQRLHESMEKRLAALKNPWALAGFGWHTEALEALGLEIGRFNTPDVKNTEHLLDLAVGLSAAMHQISWQRMSNAKMLENVDEFVKDIRGEIVHKGTTPGPLHKKGVESWITFFERLVLHLDETIGNHLASVAGEAPW